MCNEDTVPKYNLECIKVARELVDQPTLLHQILKRVEIKSFKMASNKIVVIFLFFQVAFASLVLFVTSSVDEDHFVVNREVDHENSLAYLSPRYDQEYNSSSIKRSGAKQSGRSKTNRTGLRRPTVRRVVHPSLHAAWDESNHLCALAKFQATFTIKYETSSGSSSQLIDKMPPNARSKGRCDQFDEEPVLDIMWKDIHQSTSFGGSGQQNGTVGFTFRIIFQKFTEDDDRWGVQQMQLLYNTGHSVFRGVDKPKKFIVRSNKEDYRLQFRTTFSRSVLCPSPPPIQMYDSDGTLRVIARLSNMQLQAFDFSDARQGSNFDAFERCGQVSFGSGVAKQNMRTAKYDGLTFMIGLMTVCIATLTVVGYAIYRSNALKTKEYKTMVD